MDEHPPPAAATLGHALSQRRVLEEAMVALIREFEREVGLRVQALELSRPYDTGPRVRVRVEL